MAKLLKLRRGTTTQHGSFTGAEGEVTIDTTKDTAVVHDGSQAGGRPLLREDMSNLPAGTIDNADVNASAAIARTKLANVDVVDDTTPQLGGNLDVQASEITTSTSNGNIKVTPNGTGKVEVKGNGSNDAQVVLNCGNNSHGQTIKAPPHSAGVSNTFTLPATSLSSLGGGGAVLRASSTGQLTLDTASFYINGQDINVASGADINLGQGNQIVFDSDNTNTHQISFIGPNSLTKTSDYTLPEDGSAGQFLTTNGSGVLSFAGLANDAVGADQLAGNSVVSASIVDGSIVNADINASAAIAGSKVAPDFSAQNVATTGTISDGKGNVRSIPSNAQGGAYVGVAADAGKAIYISTGGVTLNNSVFSAGDAVSIINNSGSNQTITQGSGVTLYNTGDATTGNRTLAQRGMCTVWFAAADTAYISGSGLS